MTSVTISAHTEGGTVTPIVVGRAGNSETERYHGVTMVSSEGPKSSEGGRRGKRDVSINIINMVI